MKALLLILSVGAAFAQPFLYYRGVANAASFAPSGLPNGQLARGSIFSVFGRGLGPAAGVQVSAFPLANSLGGVGIEICQNGSCVPAIPIYVRQDQINAIVPSDAPLGAVSLRVSFNGASGNYTSATIVPRSVGIFTINSGGFGPAVAQNFVSATEQPVNSLTVPAKPGQTMILWTTGLGPGLNADNLPPRLGDLPVDLQIWVGGKLVTANRYRGRSGCCAGLDQIVFDLPPDTPSGCYVPIQLVADGIMSNSATIAVSPEGQACADPFNPISERFRQGGRLGFVAVNRTSTLRNYGNTQPEEILESVTATFRRVEGGPFYFDPEISLPPPGTCTAQTVRGHLFGGDELPGFVNPGAELNAGSELRLASQAVPRDGRSGLYQGLVANSLDGASIPGTTLTPSTTLTGTGGTDVGAFQVAAAAPGALVFANRAALDALDRSQGLTVSWQGGDASRDLTLVTGVGVNLAENSSVQILCTAPGGDGSFTIPARMLQAFPTLADRVGEDAFSYITVGRSPLRTPQSLNAPGLDAGFAVNSQWSSRAVMIP